MQLNYFKGANKGFPNHTNGSVFVCSTKTTIKFGGWKSNNDKNPKRMFFFDSFKNASTALSTVFKYRPNSGSFHLFFVCSHSVWMFLFFPIYTYKPSTQRPERLMPYLTQVVLIKRQHLSGKYLNTNLWVCASSAKRKEEANM